MIKIEDLDEFEGLTADMVRAWLRAKGWTVKRADRFREWWEKGAEGEEDGFWLPAEFGVEWFWIHALAAVHGLTVQSLLREIHPRMRRGRPSQAERDAHEGPWLASLPGSHVLLVGNFSDDGETFFPGLAGPMRNTCEGAQDWMDAWAFWPCDQHGNKTRRGA